MIKGQTVKLLDNSIIKHVPVGSIGVIQGVYGYNIDVYFTDEKILLRCIEKELEVINET